MCAHIGTRCLEWLRFFKSVDDFLAFGLSIELLVEVVELHWSEYEPALELLFECLAELAWNRQVVVHFLTRVTCHLRCATCWLVFWSWSDFPLFLLLVLLFTCGLLLTGLSKLLLATFFFSVGESLLSISDLLFVALDFLDSILVEVSDLSVNLRVLVIFNDSVPLLVDPPLRARPLISLAINAARQVVKLIARLVILVRGVLHLTLIIVFWQCKLLDLCVIKSLAGLLVLQAEPSLIKLIFR